MRTFVRQMLTNRGVLATLALLLALGPFLHGHFGSSHQTGFHLDGLDALEHLHTTGPVEQANAFDIESPAVGVAIAVSRSEELRGETHDISLQPVLYASLLLCLTLSLTKSVNLLPARRAPPIAASGHGRPGAPPPALAPPELT